MNAKLSDILIARTDGQHGVGEIGAAMAPVSGFVLAAPGEPTVYIAGDTILCDEVRAAVAEYRPDYIVVNASAAQFNEGGPIVMNNEDVAQLSKEAPDATIVAVAANSLIQPALDATRPGGRVLLFAQTVRGAARRRACP